MRKIFIALMLFVVFSCAMTTDFIGEWVYFDYWIDDNQIEECSDYRTWTFDHSNICAYYKSYSRYSNTTGWHRYSISEEYYWKLEGDRIALQDTTNICGGWESYDFYYQGNTLVIDGITFIKD